MISLRPLLVSLLVAYVGLTTAKPTPKAVSQPVVTYLGSQSTLLSGGAMTSKAIVFTSGTVPSFNGSIVSGGIEAQTAQVIKNIGVVLEEAGTSWEYVMKCTVFLANMTDYAAMNAVYGSMLPNPKPARTAVEVGKLPGNFLVEIEAIAAVPDK